MAIQEYDAIALTSEVEAVHKETNQPILLKRGQVGTTLMSFKGEAYLVDFADSNGKTYAMETIPFNKLMTLIYEPTLAHA